MKKHLLAVAVLVSFCFRSNAQLVINEYSCSNMTTITDNFGSYEDWIEIYNTSASAVSLTGWYLSNKATNPLQWQFTSGSVPANGFVLAWASKTDTTIGANYHTNFKLTQCKPDYLMLTDPGGVVIDSFVLNPTKKDHSRARTTNGGAAWGVDITPTPGASNTSVKPDYCSSPTVSLPGGFYPAAISLTLTCADPNTEIRYTTNGLEPTTGSALYSAPINISATQMIRACAFPINGNLNEFSMIETNTYFINDNYSLPVISFGGDYNTLFSSGPNNSFTINSSVEYWDKNDSLKTKGYGLSDPHGNDSWAFPQKGFDYEVKDEMGLSYRMHYNFFPQYTPRQNYGHIIMKAAANDNYPFGPSIYGIPGAHIRDAFIQAYAQRHDMEMDYRTYAPAICFINGQYWGVYEIREKHDEVDYTKYYYNQSRKDDDILAFWGGLTIKMGSDTAWNNLYTFMTTQNLAIPANFGHVDDRLNLTSVMDYMIYCTYIVDSDWLNWNTLWWRGRHINNSGRNKWTYDLWDMDNSFDLGQNYTGWPTTGMQAGPCDVPSFSGSGPQIGHIAMLNALLATDTFKCMYIQRYAELMNTTLRCDSMVSFLDTLFAHITPEMQGQINKWGGTYAAWQANVTFLRNTVIARCNYIDSVINDCYQTTGPYAVTTTVCPAGGGNVKINTSIPSSYPYTGNFFGGLKLWFHAIPGSAPFDHWEVNHHVINNSQFSPDMYLMLTQDDTVTAFFVDVVPTQNVTIIPNMSWAGTISIQGYTPPSYPYTSTYPSGQIINFVATPNVPNYAFQYWSCTNHLFNPSATQENTWFALQNSDTVYAHFVSLTGTNNIDAGSGIGVDVYPTINNGQFFIDYKLPEAMDLAISVYNVTGQKVAELLPSGYKENDTNKKKLDVNLANLNLAEGIYYVQFNTPKFSKVYRIDFVNN